jgi:hypothetical protein
MNEESATGREAADKMGCFKAAFVWIADLGEVGFHLTWLCDSSAAGGSADVRSILAHQYSAQAHPALFPPVARGPPR